MFKHKPQTPVATTPTILAAMRIQQSAYGVPIPIVLGTQRVSGFILDDQDFKSIAHTTQQSSGGKGGHQNNATTTTTISYTAAVVIGLCEGQINGLFGVWDTKGRLALLSATETYTVPAGGGTIGVSQQGSNFQQHIGITRADAFSVVVNDYGSPGSRTVAGIQQTPLVLVGGAPSVGQYQHNGTGGYTFAAGDAGAQVSITYVFQVPDSSTSGNPSTQLSLTLFSGSRPQTAWSYMSSAHPNNAIARAGLAYLANSAMDLGTGGSLPNYSYEVSGLKVFGGNTIDANPSDMISEIVTNQFWGCQIDPSFLGSMTQFSNYCVASGTFLSLVIDTQDAASGWLQKIIDCCNAAPVWSNGQLKIIPYCDSTIIGNGVTFTPSTTPIYDLTNDDFEEGDSPIQIDRESVADVYNCIQIEWTNRANSYNPEIIEAKDDASIFLYGLRMASVESLHCIVTQAVAQIAVDAKLKRSVNIRKKYRFTLSWRYCLLEPMDLVTLTSTELGLNKEPVRIISIEEDEEGKLAMIAEEFPWGTATATQYPKQISTSVAPQFDIDPGNVATPVVFEPPTALSKSGQHELWIAVSGATENLLLMSEQFDNAAWNNSSGATVTPNVVTDPLNGSTADSIAFSGGSTFRGQNNLAPGYTIASLAFTFAVWLKVPSGSAQFSLIVEDQTTGIVASKSITLTTAWQQFSLPVTFGVGATGWQVFLFSPSVAMTVHAWGAQFNHGSAVQGYIQTTSASLRQANPNWGGCSVRVSYDNATFTKLPNPISAPARMGVLASTQASGNDPDTVNACLVDLTSSGGILSSTTKADADTFRTICYVDGEFQSYGDVNLTATGKYSVGQVQGGGAIYLRRGLYGSQISAHSSGKSFVRLDDAVYKIVYDPAMIGKTIFLKFTSFNRVGLREQSESSVIVYSFTLLGIFNPNSSLGFNLLPNPRFDLNIGGTPLNTALAVGASAMDNYKYADFYSHGGSYQSGASQWQVKIDNTNVPRSAPNSLLVTLQRSLTIPASALWYQATIFTDKTPVTPGQRYSLGGYIRVDASAGLPANISVVSGIRPVFFDASGTLLDETGVGATEIAAANGVYATVGGFLTIPATIAGSIPAFMVIACSCWLLNGTGANFLTGANDYWIARFDDLWCIFQNSLGDDSSSKQGSQANSYTGALSYSSTTTSITWSWNFIASRTDLHLVRQIFNSSQLVSGLSASTSYNFYPFIDEFVNVVSMVATGGLGTPSWAHSGTNVAWTAEQTRSDHFALTSGPAAGATTSSGTGGGSSGGGIGGSCLRSDVLAETRERGIIAHAELEVGMHVKCPVDADTPEGWARVEYVKHARHTEWVHSFFTCDDWLPTTAGHAFTLSDESMKRAAQLSLEDEIPCETGICWLSGHYHRSYAAQKTQITIASRRHVYYAGMKKPQVLQHNILPNT